MDGLIDMYCIDKFIVNRGVPGLFYMLRQFCSYTERLLQCWVNTQQRFRQGNKVTKINSVSMTTESTHKSNIFLYTGGDSMFLYRFVRRRRRRRSQILVRTITFRFHIIYGNQFIFSWDIANSIFDLEFSRSNIEFAISQQKMVWLPRNEKQTYRLKSGAQMWPSGLTLAMTLTINFQGQIWNFLYLSPKWSDCHETKSKHIDWTLRLKCDHRVWPWPWPWP